MTTSFRSFKNKFKKHFFDKQPISKENFIKQIQLRDYKFYLSEMMMLKIDRSPWQISRSEVAIC